ncbi:MAG TPA: tRNA (adenosine(37)-N6)-threonylcarbamoyltransferase complex dimerization subunit type 1 TsaB [Bryobacteraceae bacterium]|jgi:tRNA threonylcarbamoyladenosine biosynthesis protein TsaB|nr:tRNA (adenosine(37)-N6)-threonylcarbamoyltransferase complex dimerization subunit type 1 TsaB [Bryobacteraceae bacterium]
MNILAIDTTSEFGSVAIRGDGALRAAQHIHSPGGFADLIFQAIEETIANAGLVLSQIDCFAAASGPGGFTGVRVGLAAIKGLAEATGKPAAAISDLRAAAAFGSAEKRAVILDARRGQVFAAIYSAGLALISPEVVTDLASWLEKLRDFDGEFIAPLAFQEKLAPRPFVAARPHLASAVALCAELDGRKGLWSSSIEVDANYVRRPDAELFWRG